MPWKFVAMATSKEVKDTLFGHFQPNNLKSTRWKFLILIYFCLIDKRNSLTNFEENLSIWFRATLNLWKNEVALNPIDRIFWKFAEMFSLTIKQKYIENKNFYQEVFEL